MSVNIHNGIEASRRDDLISLGYVVIWLQIAKLPWQGIRHNNNDVQNYLGQEVKDVDNK